MTHLGNGLSNAERHEDALSVKEAELAMMRRIGADEKYILVMQSNLATTYHKLGRFEEANRMVRDVYSGTLKLNGEEHEETLEAANNWAADLLDLRRFEEARSLLRKTIPVAQRVLSDSNETTIRMRWIYAKALYKDEAATLDHLRESVATYEDTERIARRVFGGAHPLTSAIEDELQNARAALRRRAPPPESTMR